MIPLGKLNQRVLLLLLLLVGCAPSAYQALLEHQLSPDKPFCDAIEPIPPSRLNEVWKRFTEPLEAGKTGIHLLEDGAGALTARGWLTDNATKSIDIQYFIFSADNVGLIAIERLLLAAKRGVKVRLLVDDLLVDGDANILQAVNAHPNISIRIYNPSINIGKSFVAKLGNIIVNFRGMNQRMHNKTFIVDGRVAITGGRNIADEYFDFNREYNFRDRDVLLFGPVVSQLDSSFDEFWQCSLSIPLELILDEPKDFEPKTLWTKLHQYACDPERFLPIFRQRILKAPETFATFNQQGHLIWSKNIRFVSDKPGKNTDVRSLSGGGLSTDVLIGLLEKAEKNIMIQSPYVVLTDLGLGLFRNAKNRGVQVQILTNSMAATDNYTAFSGYSRVRNELIKMGVELYEFRPDAALRRNLITSPIITDAAMGLHAKSMVIDEHIVIVGTFNLDPRSANLNTECVVIIDSPELGERMARLMRADIAPENAWPSTLEDNPDDKASFWAAFRVFLSRIVPKSIL